MNSSNIVLFIITIILLIIISSYFYIKLNQTKNNVEDNINKFKIILDDVKSNETKELTLNKLKVKELEVDDILNANNIKTNNISSDNSISINSENVKINDNTLYIPNIIASNSIKSQLNMSVENYTKNLTVYNPPIDLKESNSDKQNINWNIPTGPINMDDTKIINNDNRYKYDKNGNIIDPIYVQSNDTQTTETQNNDQSNNSQNNDSQTTETFKNIKLYYPINNFNYEQKLPYVIDFNSVLL